MREKCARRKWMRFLSRRKYEEQTRYFNKINLIFLAFATWSIFFVLSLITRWKWKLNFLLTWCETTAMMMMMTIRGRRLSVWWILNKSDWDHSWEITEAIIKNILQTLRLFEKFICFSHKYYWKLFIELRLPYSCARLSHS